MNIKEKLSFHRIFELIKRERTDITAIYFYSIINGIIQISIPLGIQAILGYVLGATIVSSVIFLIIAIILGFSLSGFLQVLQLKIIERLKQKIFVYYGFKFAETIPRLDSSVYSNVYLPEKVNYFLETINVQKGLSKILIDVPTSIISMFVGLIVISLYHPLFIIFSVSLTILVLLVFKYSSKEGIKTSIDESNKKYKTLLWLEEMSRIVKDFKFSQGTDMNIKKMDDATVEFLEEKKKHFNVLLFQYNFLIIFKVTVTAFMLILGAYLLFNQKINIGQFVSAEIIIYLIISSIEKLILNLDNVYDVNTGLYKLDQVLLLAQEPTGSVTLFEDSINIDISNLTYSYTPDQIIIDKLNMQILPNKITCITGREHSGKTTLMKILIGLLDDYTGSININNVPLKNLDKKSLREKTGVYFNENSLFHGTVLDNVLLGKEHIDRDDINRFMIDVGFSSLLMQLPQGLDTKITSLGRSLNHSTIKKLLLLRTMIHKPKLLVMEEPFNDLDDVSSQHLVHFLNKIAAHTTIVILAHSIPQSLNYAQLINLSEK